VNIGRYQPPDDGLEWLGLIVALVVVALFIAIS
jgi:hypothetical protein